MPEASIIIPAYNEERTIVRTILAIADFFQRSATAYEILVVDDGSTDATAQVVQDLKHPYVRVLRSVKNLGKGAAVRTGMLAGQGTYRLFIDADYQIPITHYEQAQSKFKEGADVVITSSQVEPAREQFFQYRYYLGRFSKWLIRFVMQWRFVDTQRGLKFFTARAAEEIFSRQTIERWGFDIEVLAIAVTRGFSVKEIPVTYAANTTTRVSAWSYLYALWELAEIRFKLSLGSYEDGNTRNRLLIVVLVGILALLAAFLLSNYIFFDGDTIGIFYPDYSSASRIWNSGILLGFPSPASFQWGYFNPVYQVLSLHYNFLIALYVLLSGILTYLFAQKIHFNRTVSTVVALLFALGQTNSHWVGNVAVISAAATMPAAFLGVRALFHGPRWHIWICSLVVGLSLLGAHLQFVIMSLVAAGMYGIFLGLRTYSVEKNLRGIRKPLVYAAVSLLASILIGLPQLIYTAVFTPLSTRLGGLSWSQASVDAATPLDLIKFVLPHFSFRYGVSAEFLPYIGVFGLVFVLIAILKLYKSDSEVRFFTVFSILILLTTFKYSPLFWLLHQVPVLEYFRGPARWTFALNFTMAILAGYGMRWAVENWAKFQNLASRIVGSTFVAVAGLGVFSSVVFVMFGDKITRSLQELFDTRMYADTTKLPLEYYHQLIQKIVNDSFSNLYILNSELLIALLSLGSAYVVIRYSRTTRTFALSASVVTFLSLGAVAFAGLSFARSDVIEKIPPVAEFIMSKEGSDTAYRTFSFLSGMASSQKISAVHPDASKDAILYGMDSLMPNTGLFWGIPNADGYEPMAPRRGQRVLAYIGSEANQRFLSLANTDMPIQEKLILFTSRLPVLSMLNIKYLISPYELPKTDGLELAETFTSTRYEVPIYLYENTHVLPRLYFTNGVTHVTETDEEKNFSSIIESGGDFSKNTFIECPDCNQYKNQPSKSDALDIQEYRDGYLNLTANAEKGRWLIFSESYLPGWKITIDGEPAQSYMANYLFHGLYIPEGVHRVVFEYVGLLTTDSLTKFFR